MAENGSAVVTVDLSEQLRLIVREEVRSALVEVRPEPSPWFDVAGAATYAAMSEDAIRSAEKRGQLRGHRGATGRVRFTKEDLEAFLRGEAA